MSVLLGTVEWFDQDYAHTLFLVKGVLALIATVLVVGHMVATWQKVVSLGQRLRYGALLYLTANVTFASVEQVGQDGLLVSYRHLTSVVGALIVIAAMVISILEDRRELNRPRGATS